MSPLFAITRQVSAGIGRCELSHLERETIDHDLAAAQHRRYEECLSDLGCRVQSLPAEPGLPDSVFVEDCAVVLDELAIITRPGAASRRPETASIAAALEPYRALFRIEAPGTLDGGDVLILDQEIYVGSSRRSNSAGVDQLRAIVAPRGFSVTPVPVESCLHLKSAVTRVKRDTLLVNPRWIDAAPFRGARLVEVDPAEPFGANALLIDETVVYPACFERTLKRLEDAGCTVAPVDVSEIAKAEGGVTCCSLILQQKTGNNK